MKTFVYAVLLVAAAFAASGAWAGVTLSSFPPNPNVLPGGGWQFSNNTTFANPTGARAWVNGVYGGVPKFVATDTLALAGRAGALPVTLVSTVGLQNGAAAVARCLIGGGPLICGLGSAAAVAYGAYRVTRPTSGTGLTSDPGLEPTPGASGFNYDGRGWAATREQACEIAADAYYGNSGDNGVVEADEPRRCFIYRSGTFMIAVAISGSQTSPTSCPAQTDPTDPAGNVPAGGPIGPDGKCPSARYNHLAKTVAQVAAMVAANPPTFPNDTWRDALRDSVDSGGQTVPADPVVSGPASQIGPETVTGTTTGTPPVTTTRTSSDTYTYNYAGDTITTTTTNTTTINNGGDITTIVTNSPPASPQDPEDPCTASPARAGCTDLGTPPDAEAIPNTDVPISYTPTIFASNASCPSAIPLSFSVSGGSYSYSLSFEPMCDLMTLLRPLFLAFGAATAAMIFMAGLKDL